MGLLKLYARMAFAFVVIVLILAIAQRWDDADSQRAPVSMAGGA